MSERVNAYGNGLLPGYLEFTQGLLPLDRMREVEAKEKDAYRARTPFPHIVLEDFFEPSVLDRVLAEFPSYNDWEIHADPNWEMKRISRGERELGFFTRYFIYALHSSAFITFLEGLTGIEGLVPDPHLWGGGLHETLPGGKLSVHADFNRHPHLKLHRRLNVLIYLNRDWREEWGGHLELWERDMSRRALRLAPKFNRVVCFNTTDDSFHGNPDPLACPPGHTRRSLALYYYSGDRPEHEISDFHSTLWQRRPGKEAPATWRERLDLRGLAKRFVPPIVFDARRALFPAPKELDENDRKMRAY